MHMRIVTQFRRLLPTSWKTGDLSQWTVIPVAGVPRTGRTHDVCCNRDTTAEVSENKRNAQETS